MDTWYIWYGVTSISAGCFGVIAAYCNVRSRNERERVWLWLAYTAWAFSNLLVKM